MRRASSAAGVSSVLSHLIFDTPITEEAPEAIEQQRTALLCGRYAPGFLVALPRPGALRQAVVVKN